MLNLILLGVLLFATTAYGRNRAKRPMPPATATQQPSAADSSDSAGFRQTKAPGEAVEALEQDYLITPDDPGAPPPNFGIADQVPDTDASDEWFAVPSWSGPPRHPPGWNREPADESPEATLRGNEKLWTAEPSELGHRMRIVEADLGRGYMEDNRRWLSRTDVTENGASSSWLGDLKTKARMPPTHDYGVDRTRDVDHLPPTAHRWTHRVDRAEPAEHIPMRETVDTEMPLRGERHIGMSSSTCRQPEQKCDDDRSHWRTLAPIAAWSFWKYMQTSHRTHDQDAIPVRATQREELERASNPMTRTNPFRQEVDDPVGHVARQAEVPDPDIRSQPKFASFNPVTGVQQRTVYGLYEVDTRPQSQTRPATTTAVRPSYPEEEDRQPHVALRINSVDEAIIAAWADNPFGTPQPATDGRSFSRGRRQ